MLTRDVEMGYVYLESIEYVKNRKANKLQLTGIDSIVEFCSLVDDYGTSSFHFDSVFKSQSFQNIEFRKAWVN